MEEQILGYLPSGRDWLTKRDAKLVRLAILISNHLPRLNPRHKCPTIPRDEVRGIPVGNLPRTRGKESLDSQSRLVNTTPNYQSIILIF